MSDIYRSGRTSQVPDCPGESEERLCGQSRGNRWRPHKRFFILEVLGMATTKVTFEIEMTEEEAEYRSYVEFIKSVHER
jgi:hypothetical protein